MIYILNVNKPQPVVQELVENPHCWIGQNLQSSQSKPVRDPSLSKTLDYLPILRAVLPWMK